MKVAVQEGGVAILPPSFDEAKLDALAPRQSESMVDAVVDSIVQAAPVVAKGQELSIATTDLAKADAIVSQVQGELASDAGGRAGRRKRKPRRPAGRRGSVALPESIARSLKDYASAAPASVQKTVSSKHGIEKTLREGGHPRSEGKPARASKGEPPPNPSP